MQQGDIVIMEDTSDCSCTRTGKHQVDDYCRICGDVGGVKQAQDEIGRLRLGVEREIAAIIIDSKVPPGIGEISLRARLTRLLKPE